MASGYGDATGGWGGLEPLPIPAADLHKLRAGFYCPHVAIDFDADGAQVSTVGADGICRTCKQQVREPMVCGKRPAAEPL